MLRPQPRSPLFTDCLGIQDLNASNAALLGNILELERSHQGVFLGQDGAVHRLADPATYALWTNAAPSLSVEVFLDTRSRTVLLDKKGVWELGNLFIAGAREMLFLSLNLNSSSQFL